MSFDTVTIRTMYKNGILLLFGQPASGKTTLARWLKSAIDADPDRSTPVILIDGDRWREITRNKDYTREGRIRNLKGAFDMALYLEKEGFLVILSFVTPYAELRDHLRSQALSYREVWLVYEGDRGRNGYFAIDFEVPGDDVFRLDTSRLSLQDCIDKLIPLIQTT
jgi:adenylylsulfate kinase-like enzyme